MSKTTRQALYERLRKTQSDEIICTCSRAELPLIRQQSSRIGWRLRVLHGENTVTISVTRQ